MPVKEALRNVQDVPGDVLVHPVKQNYIFSNIRGGANELVY